MNSRLLSLSLLVSCALSWPGTGKAMLTTSSHGTALKGGWKSPKLDENLLPGALMLLGAGVTVYAAKQIEKNATLISGCEKVGINGKQATQLLSLAIFCAGLGKIAEGSPVGKILTHAAIQLPILVTSSVLSKNKHVKNIIWDIPGIGQYLGCKNPECLKSGATCNECSTKSDVQFGAIYSLLNTLYWSYCSKVF